MTRSGRELLYLAVALAMAFAYLGVPVWSSLLIAVAIMSQCAAGALLLDRMLGNFGTTTLHLLGPSLVVGGALSFVVFNAVGRGPIGLLAVCGLGAVSFLLVSMGSGGRVVEPGDWWLLVQLIGMASLSLSWEFPEMLPVAIACLLLGPLAPRFQAVTRQIAMPITAAAALALLIPPIFRQDYWWLVTDDYSFFSMLSQHLTMSGPLANWGSVSFVRYHWLSYGWSGLLNELGGRPGNLTTLSLVIPFTYSLSLAASLVLAVRRLRREPLTIAALIPVWTIIASNTLDWSGTSTAGVYAVNAAVIAVAVVSVESTKSAVVRFAVYGGFLGITAVTKLASTFAVALVFLVAEMYRIVRTREKPVVIATLCATCVLGAAGILPAMWLVGRLTDGFSVAIVNPGLGQLSTFGALFVLASLAVQRMWIIIPLIVLLIIVVIRSKREPQVDASLLVLGLAPLALFGLVLDLVVSGDSEGFNYGESSRFQYFSGPMYFFGSVALLSSVAIARPAETRPQRFMTPVFLTSAFLASGVLWERLGLGNKIWSFVGLRLADWSDLTVALLQFVSVDGRIAASLVVLPSIPLIRRMSPSLSLGLLNSLIASTVAVTVYSYASPAVEMFRSERSLEEIEATVGSETERSIGVWLRMNSSAKELIATNDLYHTAGEELSTDFSLAVWSERRFLVVGPSLLRVFGPIDEDLRLSTSFGLMPNAIDAAKLRERGVSWFIVKRSSTEYTEWEQNWDVRYANEQYLLVHL